MFQTGSSKNAIARGFDATIWRLYDRWDATNVIEEYKTDRNPADHVEPHNDRMLIAAIISVRRTIYAFVGKYHINKLRQNHHPRFYEKNKNSFYVFLWFCSFSNIFTKIPCGAAWLKARKTFMSKNGTIFHRGVVHQMSI